MVHDYLKAGLTYFLHVVIAPILLGGGIRLWDDLRGLEAGYNVKSETAESGTIHLTFAASCPPANMALTGRDITPVMTGLGRLRTLPSSMALERI